jgi:uncharacterized membrane protein YeaQ/YmgE (transglycosylase-associated protein family)
VWFILIGLAAGWLAGQVMKGGGFGVLGDIVVGVTGALLGGFLFRTFGVSAGGGFLGSLIRRNDRRYWLVVCVASGQESLATNVPPIEVGGVKLAQFGQSSGMRGLPGDFTPPSRFVRAVAFSQWALTLRHC